MAVQLVLAAITAGIGVFQAVSGAKQAAEAKSDINSYKRQDLSDLSKTIKLRTESQDFEAEQTDRTLAGTLDVLRQGGSFTNATALANQAIESKRNIAKNIEQQRNRLDLLSLQERSNVRQLQEQRERDDLAGLGAQLASGQAQQAQGLSAIGSAALTAATSLGGSGGGEKGPKEPNALKKGKARGNFDPANAKSGQYGSYKSQGGTMSRGEWKDTFKPEGGAFDWFGNLFKKK